MQLGFCGSVPDSSTRTPLLQSWGWSAFVVAVPAGYVTRPPVPCVPHFWGRDPSTVWLCGLRRCGGGQPALVGLPAVRPRSVHVLHQGGPSLPALSSGQSWEIHAKVVPFVT